ncbi:hypothetical protein [Flavobacterium aestivum]|uniref:hypothetical protein n=1 Tax=Flavobacterium aestivum TaxID=3003257 RepID=UPI0024831053|nr:hypothetical protein [Flavobacterium aestivum]
MATRATVEPKIAAINDKGNNTALEVRTVLTELLDFSDEGLIQNNTKTANLEVRTNYIETINNQQNTSINAINTKITNLETRASSIEVVNNQQNTSINTINTKINAIDSININQTDRIIALENKSGTSSLTPFHFWKPDPIIIANNVSLWYSFKGIERQTVNFTFKIRVTENISGPLFFPLDDEVYKTINSILEPDVQEDLSFVVAVNNSENRVSTGNIYNPRIWTAYIKFEDKGVIFNLFNLQEKNILRFGDEIFTSIHFHCPEFKFNF